MRLWLLGCTLAVCAWAQGPIRLKSGAIDPARAGRRLPAGQHFIVQFRSYPDAATRAELARRGIGVLSYVPENALMVSAAPGTDLNGLDVTWTGSLTRAEKISPSLERDGSGAYLLVFHRDISLDRARAIAEAGGLAVIDNPDLLPGHLVATGAWRRVAALADRDELAYIMPASHELVGRRPVYRCGGPITEAGPLSEYVLVGNGWPRDAAGTVALRFFFDSLPQGLEPNTAEGEITRAFAEWAKYAAISFSAGAQAGAARSIDLLFARGAHGDGYPFDGPGGVLAHTFYPAPPNPETIAGDMHFDADESWHAGSTVDLFSVALHEAGHALGLGHSDNPNSVMYPYYRMQTGLTADDIAGIQALYGSAQASAPPPAPPAPPAPPTRGSTPGSGGTRPSGGPTDSTPPAITIVSPASTIVQTTAASITISGVASDNAGVTAVKWATSTGSSGNAWGTASWSAVVPLMVGTNTVTVRAYDAAGNSGWRAITVVRR